MIRFRRLGLAFLACCSAAFAMRARADGYPDRPIHFIVGWAPGGGTDLMARLIGKKLSEQVGQPVIVENRTGASGTIAAGYVAHAAPDGYTLVEIAPDNSIAPLPPGQKLDFDPLHGFAAITEIGVIPMSLVVNAQVPVSSLQEFVAYAKANPGKLNIGTSGAEGVGHWAATFLKQLMGIQVENIAYTGGGPALTALLGNEVQLTFSPVATSLQLVKAGKLKALAVTGDSRSPLLPDVPTFIEVTGQHGFEDMSEFYGIMVPAGTPRAIVDRLHDEIVPILKSEEFRGVMEKRGFNVVTSTPEEFAELMRQSAGRWVAMQPFLASASK